MRRVRLHLNGGGPSLPPPLTATVLETPEEQRVGLQGFRWLLDTEGMYFPSLDPRGGRMSISMMSVGFPIDVLFFREGRVARIVGSLQPGDPRIWELDRCSGVLEVRGGWAADYGVRLGDPLFVST